MSDPFETMAAPTLLCVVGARPNFIKMAPILQAFALHAPAIAVKLVHTGQHYGDAMDRQYFSALGLREPDFNLGVGSASHAKQTAEIMLRFDPVLDSVRPAAVLVVGDVNSTLACALTAQKKGIPVIHVEAGLRSHDRAMPEEINRLLTDQLADLLLTSEADAAVNLQREGIDAGRVRFVGNVLIDSLQRHVKDAVPFGALLAKHGRADFLQADNGYAVFTAHRPTNVDQPADLLRTLDLVANIARRLPVVLPLHPRTRVAIEAAGLQSRLQNPALLVTEPLGYFDMLGAMRDARAIVTDSGGMQEEATVLGVPCITLRTTTERPVTLDCGGNVLAGEDSEKALRILDEILAGGHRPRRSPELWDGQAARRIVEATRDWLNEMNAYPRTEREQRAA